MKSAGIDSIIRIGQSDELPKDRLLVILEKRNSGPGEEGADTQGEIEPKP